MKIAIGAPTYNDFSRINSLLASIFELTDFDLSEVGIVVLDDGTPDRDKVSQLKQVCEKYKVDFLEHDHNKGIPAAWNTLTRHFDSEYMVLFNDDIKIHDKNWLKCLIYFLDNNEKVANVGFPLIQINTLTGEPRDTVSLDYDGRPGRVGAPVGCSFAFKRKAFNDVGGFWEDIRSFYEETDFGFELAKKGYYSYMMPYPAMEHWGSQTFAKNFELNIQDVIDKLPMDEYKRIMLQKYPIEKIEPFVGKVYRMDYSRVLFAKKWGCEDYWNIPQVEVHKKYVDVLESIEIKWLDKNMLEKTDTC